MKEFPIVISKLSDELIIKFSLYNFYFQKSKSNLKVKIIGKPDLLHTIKNN
jgi:hypothetical protein